MSVLIMTVKSYVNTTENVLNEMGNLCQTACSMPIRLYPYLSLLFLYTLLPGPYQTYPMLKHGHLLLSHLSHSAFPSLHVKVYFCTQALCQVQVKLIDILSQS